MGSGCRRGLRGFLIRVGKLSRILPFRVRMLLLTGDVGWDSMISYPNYKFIFPIKALGMYERRSGAEAKIEV